MNTTAFGARIIRFSTEYDDRDLETYLLALFSLIEQHKDERVTHELVFDLLGKAFTNSPNILDPEWLNCNNPPDCSEWQFKYTQAITKVEDATLSGLTPYTFTLEMVKFLIADLHKMRGKQLEDENRYFGIRSETGHYWYNFDPFSILRCGSACMYDNRWDISDLDWSFMGLLLDHGRQYE